MPWVIILYICYVSLIKPDDFLPHRNVKPSLLNLNNQKVLGAFDLCHEDCRIAQNFLVIKNTPKKLDITVTYVFGIAVHLKNHYILLQDAL